MKPYDLALLLEKLKGKGLAVAEEASEQVFESVVEWLEESAKASELPWDDFVLVLTPKLKEVVKAQLEKIDGK
jgi:vacuolar-type H+-ATPase subunit E/Vma4